MRVVALLAGAGLGFLASFVWAGFGLFDEHDRSLFHE